MIDMLTKQQDIRKMFLTYDNIIQSVDYGFLQLFLSKYDVMSKIFHLKIFKDKSKDLRQQFLINRPERDLLKWLSNNKITYDNCNEYGIDYKQRNEIYFNDVFISTFGNNLVNLLAKGYIEKLIISVDLKNKYKLQILDDLFNEYYDIVKIVNDDTETKVHYFRDKEMNTIVTDDEQLLYDNKDYLKGKSIMINNCSYIYDIHKHKYIYGVYKDIKITKNKWESLSDYTVSFIEPYTYKNTDKGQG